MRQRLHPLAKTIIAAASGFVTDRNSSKAAGFTRPPFAHLVVIHQMHDSFPPCCGRHHFFPKRSFKAALSSIASARSRFSFVFSSSSVFSRLASDYLHASELGLPFIDAGIADAMLAGKAQTQVCLPRAPSKCR
jgi:hypothetical protein